MATWRIYYSDHSVVEGTTEAEWIAAPASGVLVVVLMDPPAVPHRTYKKQGKNVLVEDRQLWDGVDEYDPFGWGVKYGELVSDTAFFQAWEAACGDS